LIQQPIPVSAGYPAGRFRTPPSGRALGIAGALLLESLLLLLLLSLGRAGSGGKETVTFVDFTASDAAESAPEPSESAPPAPPAAEQPAPREAEAEVRETPQPTVAAPAPVVLPPVPSPREPDPRYGVGPRPIQSPPPAGPAAGPAGGPGVAGSADSVRVGTAPNGEPLYAASWYREPYPEELRGYLSTASGPGWGLIACRTAPDYRVEDCVGLAEYPQGSMIMRSALAAAWQFKVRPPRLGGRPQIGEWVRIRIEYEIRSADR